MHESSKSFGTSSNHFIQQKQTTQFIKWITNFTVYSLFSSFLETFWYCVQLSNNNKKHISVEWMKHDMMLKLWPKMFSYVHWRKSHIFSDMAMEFLFFNRHYVHQTTTINDIFITRCAAHWNCVQIVNGANFVVRVQTTIIQLCFGCVLQFRICWLMAKLLSMQPATQMFWILLNQNLEGWLGMWPSCSPSKISR